ncbi:hypothetical protein CBR68_00230 [Bordetella hinzii]|nr:hypothetical protein CBR68_00230 [Bordetella hinzii]
MSFVDFYPTFYPAGSEADWRRFIQAALYKSLVMDYSARFFTPFFIRGVGCQPSTNCLKVSDERTVATSSNPPGISVMT